jgi:hypothetical protein
MDPNCQGGQEIHRAVGIEKRGVFALVTTAPQGSSHSYRGVLIHCDDAYRKNNILNE